MELLRQVRSQMEFGNEGVKGTAARRAAVTTYALETTTAVP